MSAPEAQAQPFMPADDDTEPLTGHTWAEVERHTCIASEDDDPDCKACAYEQALS